MTVTREGWTVDVTYHRIEDLSVMNHILRCSSAASRLRMPWTNPSSVWTAWRNASSSSRKEEASEGGGGGGGGGGALSRLLGPESAIARDPDKVNRWSMFAPAFATHLCLGAPYGWSAISYSLSKEYGLVASASADWVLDSCTYPMSIMVNVVTI